ncbi:hypothetical protein [Streptomyces cupreus]|uniref:Uncharacterized protein n=1 Tax=Streptomyces cupreus TaxID=2759956 RepID=A0A7X1J4I3_9ACTN|nr:hypothetical protein [Streptomyces cupreus]
MTTLTTTGHTPPHTAAHFWRLQLMETGIALALTAAAVLAASRLLKHRTGAAI